MNKLENMRIFNGAPIYGDEEISFLHKKICSITVQLQQTIWNSSDSVKSFCLSQIANSSDLCVVGQGKNMDIPSKVSIQMKRWDLWIDSFGTTVRSIVIDQIDIDAAQ